MWDLEDATSVVSEDGVKDSESLRARNDGGGRGSEFDYSRGRCVVGDRREIRKSKQDYFEWETSRRSAKWTLCSSWCIQQRPVSICPREVDGCSTSRRRIVVLERTVWGTRRQVGVFTGRYGT